MSLHNLLVMLVPALVSVCGGVLAALWRPSRMARSHIQHFAAGVVLAAIAVELFPEIERTHASAWALVAAFAFGSFLMYALKVWTMRLEAAEEARAHATEAAPAEGAHATEAAPAEGAHATEAAPAEGAHATEAASAEPARGAVTNRGLVVATFVDVAMDGFIIGAGFAAGGTTGLVLALGLSVELLFLGLALSSVTSGRWRIVGLSSALGGTVLVTAVLGNTFLAGASPTVIGAALAFSAAALLYLVTEELLMEAHEVPDTPTSTLVLFAGFLVFWGVQLLGT